MRKTIKKNINIFGAVRYPDSFGYKMWTMLSDSAEPVVCRQIQDNTSLWVFMDIRNVISERVRDNTTRPLKYRYKY
jgi:hypothetical protein